MRGLPCSPCGRRRHRCLNPAGRLKTPGLLRGMVEACNTQLNLGLFPEEVTAVAAVLNHDHYRFK